MKNLSIGLSIVVGVIDEKKDLIEVKPLIEASSSESEIIRTKRLLD